MRLEDTIKALADAHPQAVVLTDARLDAPGPHIIYVNAAFTRMTGYAAEEVVGRNPRMFQGPATKPLSVRAVSRALRRDGGFHGYVVNHRKNGEEYICEIDVREVLDEAGERVYFLAIEQEVRRRRGRPSAGMGGRYEPV